jgi:hypothetical protein
MLFSKLRNFVNRPFNSSRRCSQAAEIALANALTPALANLENRACLGFAALAAYGTDDTAGHSHRSQNRNKHRAARGELSRGSAQRFCGLELLDSRLLLAGDIFVTVLHDVNGNGIKDPGELPLQGWTVYVDLNRNGSPDAGEPAQLTNIDGETTFVGLAKGKYDVRETLPSGWAPSPGFAAFERINVVDGETTDVLFLNKPATTTGDIQGTVWQDVNGDGVRDPSDPGIAGWTVFLDLNANRVLDAGEPSAITDANGLYSFTGLVPKQYKVREITPAGWDPTIGFDGASTVDVTVGNVTVSDFGNILLAKGTIRGSVWNDVNADGIRAASDPGLDSWTVFLDLNGDGVAGAGEPTTLTNPLGVYNFPTVAPGTYSVVEVLQPGWFLSPGHSTSVTVVVTDNAELVADFANFTPLLGTISGTIWNDLNGDGVLSGEPGIPDWTVYLDQNGDGVLTPGEPVAVTDANGDYTLTGVPAGSGVVRDIPAIGWSPTAPGTGSQLVTILNGGAAIGINFGNKQRTDGAISGAVYVDSNQNGVRDAGERGLPGITVFMDVNNNGALDVGEPSTITSTDLFYTPAVNEAGSYQFTHLAVGVYHIREIVPVEQSLTPLNTREQVIDLLTGEDRTGVSFGNVFRLNEIHGVQFDDQNNDHIRNPGEPGLGGVTIFVDLNRNNALDIGEPSTVSAADGSYSFTGLTPGAYVVREVVPSGHEHSYPGTLGGILFPTGVSNPAVGNVSPTSITTSLAKDEVYHQTVSLTLPGSGALTNLVDVFLLFDDTGSFTANSPIVRAAFPQIITALEAGLPGINLGFGVGRFEEYANFAAEFSTGRPFILNQPIVASSTPGFSTAIQSALDRTAPGYGGDQPETDIEALFQAVTGQGFDGNNNGTVLDSGAAGLVSTQITPGNSGDVPSFASFTPDPAGGVLPAEGSLGGAGFRAGALPIILTATDTGFAYQPNGETTITGVGGVTLPISSLTQTSRPTTPFNSGAGIQQTITGLNALGALVIGLGTNAEPTLDPRQDLEAIARLTGATNQSATTIANGTLNPIAPGDPFYFQIASGFGASVANGVVNAIENAASNVAVNITLKASDPRVHILATPGVLNSVGAGQTATFDVTFTGDGIPRRFDLQFVREGTNVVLGSIPVVLGTPIPGDAYEFEDLPEGEIHQSVDFGSHLTIDTISPTSNVAALPTAVATTTFNVAWSGTDNVGGSGIATYDIFASDNGAPAALWLNHTGAASAAYSGQSFHTYAFYSVAYDVAGNAENAPAVADATTVVAAVDGTSGDDAFLVRLDPTAATMFQLFRSATATGAPAYTLPMAQLPILTLNGLDGNDEFIVDFTAGSPIPSGGLNVDAGAGANTINFTNTGAPGRASAASVSGSLNIIGGAVNVASDANGLSLTVSNSATVTFATSQHLASLTVADNAKATLAADGGHFIRASALSITPTATLDLVDNDLIFQADGASRAAVLTEIANYIKTGRNNGDWTGVGGITSSMAAAQPNHLTALPIALNDKGTGTVLYSTFDGVPVDNNAILVKYSWNGDADLSGKIDSDDYFQIDNGFALKLIGYRNGDFDFNGTVDSDDYFLIDRAFAGQSGILAGQEALAASTQWHTSALTPALSQGRGSDAADRNVRPAHLSKGRGARHHRHR